MVLMIFFYKKTDLSKSIYHCHCDNDDDDDYKFVVIEWLFCLFACFFFHQTKYNTYSTYKNNNNNILAEYK